MQFTTTISIRLVEKSINRNTFMRYGKCDMLQKRSHVRDRSPGKWGDSNRLKSPRGPWGAAPN